MESPPKYLGTSPLWGLNPIIIKHTSSGLKNPIYLYVQTFKHQPNPPLFLPIWLSRETLVQAGENFRQHQRESDRYLSKQTNTKPLHTRARFASWLLEATLNNLPFALWTQVATIKQCISPPTHHFNPA